MLRASKSQQAQNEIETRAYSFISSEFFQIMGDFCQEQIDLRQSWSDLEIDRYVKGQYPFRYRRYSRFLLEPDRNLKLLPHSSFYQSTENNSYAGGIAREFAPLSSNIINNYFLAELIRSDFDLLPISDTQRQKPWEIDVHQYRIISNRNQAGYPTPEGIHRDGFDYFAVHLMNRTNVSGGISEIYNNKQELIDTVTLSTPMDSLIVADARVMHSVTPIFPADPAMQAFRDSLVINFISEPREERVSKEAGQHAIAYDGTSGTLTLLAPD